MTPEQQLTIRAELARRMGYFVLPVGTPNHWHYQLQLPDASKYQRWRETESEAWADAPDPFTNAEDKDALVEWLAADDERWARFDNALLDCLLEAAEPIKVISKQNNCISNGSG